MIRIAPELHHAVYLKALENGKSLNAVVEDALVQAT
jgi:predicted HicB family RNase H-like nuclease